MLLAAQLAAVTLQVVSVAGVLRHPVHLVAAVGAGRHPRGGALRYRDTVKTQQPGTIQEVSDEEEVGRPNAGI